MNKLGFTAIEVSPITQMYMDYLVWRFDSLFSRLVGVRLGKSFQRTCQGHYGRHIADYSLARLTLEVAKEEDFDKAMASTINALSYNCLPLGAVPTWMDDSMREGIDGQLLVLHNAVSNMIKCPSVSLPWLTKALMPYATLSDADRDYVDQHEDCIKIARWIKRLVDNDCFVYEQTVTGGGAPAPHGGSHNYGGGSSGASGGGADTGPTVRGAKRYYPYITTGSNESEEHSYLRAKTKTKGYAEEIAKKLVKFPEMVAYSKNTGFTLDDKVLRCMIDRVTHLSLGLENAFDTEDLCNPSTLFDLAKRKLGNHAVQSPIAADVLTNLTEIQDPSYAMMSAINDGESQNIIFGVNMTLVVLLTSMCEGNNSTLANSQVDERMTKSIMSLMMRDVPMQFLGQNGNTYLRKNFRGNCPTCDFNEIENFREPRPAYIVRPLHDHEKENNKLSHFPCNVINASGYAPEDCAHMSELCALTKFYKANSILDISLEHATPRYMTLFDTCYPVAFTTEGLLLEKARLNRPETANIVGVTGYLYIASPKSFATATVAANTTPWKIEYNSSYHGFHNIKGDDVWDIDEALAKRNTVMLPLIRRHNAVVFLTKTMTFGIIQPNPVGPRPEGAGDSYFKHGDDDYGYDVFTENSRSGEFTLVHPFDITKAILPIASNIWIRADIFYMCKAHNPNHADCLSNGTNPAQTLATKMYVNAVIAYPNFYPWKQSHHTSIFVEVGYAGSRGSGQITYQPMEVNLEKIRDAKMYLPATPSGERMCSPPLCAIDPRQILGSEISIVSFTSYS
jgi:hypothetical protein